MEKGHSCCGRPQCIQAYLDWRIQMGQKKSETGVGTLQETMRRGGKMANVRGSRSEDNQVHHTIIWSRGAMGGTIIKGTGPGLLTDFSPLLTIPYRATMSVVGCQSCSGGNDIGRGWLDVKQLEGITWASESRYS